MKNGPATPFEAEELIEYLPALRGLARALVRGDEVEDLVAATMLRAVERPPKHRGNMRAWLARTLRNLAIDRGRKQGTQRRTADALEQQAAHQMVPPTPDAMMARSEALRLLHEMLDEMADPDRHLLFLRYFDGLNANEIGERLGILPATARTRLSSALGRLRARLRERYGKDAFAPCFLIIEPLSRLVPITTAAAGTAALGSYFTFKNVLLGLLPALLLLGAYLGGGDAWFGDDADAHEAQLESEQAESHRAEAMASLPKTEGDLARSPEGSRDPNLLRLVNEAGESLAEHRVQIYFEGEVVARKSGLDGSFAWPPEFEQGGLLFISAEGRVPSWHWREPLESSDRIVVPTGRELVVRAEYEDRDRAPRPHFSIDFTRWVPEPGSIGFEMRHHLEGADHRGLFDPAQAYTRDHFLKIDEQNECRFVGLPETGRIELKLRSRSFDWLGAQAGTEWQSVWLEEEEDFYTARLRLRDAWTARIEAVGPVGQQALETAGVEFSVQGSDRAEFWAPQQKENGGIDLWIPHDPKFPTAKLGEGWEAELWLQWWGARVPWSVVLPHGGGDLGVLQLAEPSMIPATVRDEEGSPVAGAELRLGDASFQTDLHGRADLPIMVDAQQRVPEEVWLRATAEGYLPLGDVQTPIADGEMQLTLLKKTGLIVRCSVLASEALDPAPVAATIRLSCLPQEQSEELPRLYERRLSMQERDLFLPDLAQDQANRAGLLKGLRVNRRLQPGEASEALEFLRLAPNGPVLLTVELGGVEVHREVIATWAKEQLIERELEFAQPETFTVRGIVRDDAGHPVPRARVFAQVEGGASLSGQAGVFGEFEIQGLPSLQFSIGVSPTEPHWLRMQRRAVDLPNAEQLIELEVRRGKKIHVHFVDEFDQPVDVNGAIVQIVGEKDSVAFGRKEGRGELSFLVPLSGQVEVQTNHLGVRAKQTFDLDATEYRFPLPSGVRVQVDWSAIELPENSWLFLMAKRTDIASESAMLELIPFDPRGAGASSTPEATAREVELHAGQYQMYLSVRDAGGGVWRQLAEAAPLTQVTIAPGTPQTLRFVPVD